MRPVRPREVPAPLSIWRWKETGTPLLVLGLRAHTVTWGTTQSLIAIELTTGKMQAPPSRNWAWTSPALGGMGPVLRDWQCVEEAPTVDWAWQQYLDDIADSDGRLAPAGLR